LAQLDFHGSYTRCPAKPSPAFPTTTEAWVPFIEIALLRPGSRRGFKTLALLDTGASLNLFHSDLADALDLDWEAAPTTPIIGISGTLKAHVLPVTLELCDARYAWLSDIAFSDQVMPGMPLLGHHGFFEHFEVRFKTAQRQFRIFLK